MFGGANCNCFAPPSILRLTQELSSHSRTFKRDEAEIVVLRATNASLNLIVRRGEHGGNISEALRPTPHLRADDLLRKPFELFVYPFDDLA